MNILDRLVDLRTSTTGCGLVALADLSSGIVLCSSAAIKLPQERLDSIANTAKNVFNMPSPAWPKPQKRLDSMSLEEVIALNSSNTQIFLRARALPYEVLCCIVSFEVDMASFAGRTRMLFGDLMRIK